MEADFQSIELRGVREHNLKSIDLDLPRGRLAVICGVSGSGKSSLALDTLYAEGQRRYIESFSAYARQFLEQLDKPDADSIVGLPPAIAVTRSHPHPGSRSTVGTVTEIVEYLRLLYSRLGQPFCPGCGEPIRRDTVDAICGEILAGTAPCRIMVLAPPAPHRGDIPDDSPLNPLEEGYPRVLVDGHLINLADQSHPLTGEQLSRSDIVVDRLVAGNVSAERLRDTIETAMRLGNGACDVLWEGRSDREGRAGGLPQPVDGRDWWRRNFSSRLGCDDCHRSFPDPQPRMFSFNSPLGACPACEGKGTSARVDPDLVIPDAGKSLRDGAIVPWTAKPYSGHQKKMLAALRQAGVRLDVPYRELDERELKLIREGVPESDFQGLDEFVQSLEAKTNGARRSSQMKWQSEQVCETCRGSRLLADALAFRVDGLNIAEFCALEIEVAEKRLQDLHLEEPAWKIGGQLVRPMIARLGFLNQVGLGYLTLDRPIGSLSGGEAQRVALTTALGSTLVNMLYVLDEPTVGLHPRDVQRLRQAVTGLRDRGNTVVVVEHESSLFEAADTIVEIGPSAGDSGGSIVFQGEYRELLKSTSSPTADFLTGRRGSFVPQRRPTQRGWIRLTGARGHNLGRLNVEFPLGVLCLVTGVSGSGKSTLVQDTLYVALCRRKRKDAPAALPYDDIFGDGQIDDVVLVDQSPIGRTPRSNPVTYIKAFDDIRRVFAETLDARTRNLTPSAFSFNVDGGRCTRCRGDGYLSIDMQFLADALMRCPQCKGTRYRQEILGITYRGRSIAEVLDMTVRNAFTFFRGQARLQARLKRLIDVGLEYLKLGQPATTLSSGEAQRLKLASYIGTKTQSRTLFLLDEPTTGLHFADIVRLLDCFEALLSTGHSLIVVEHDLQLIRAADYVIDLGPGAAAEGGQVVACGTPEEIAAAPDSITGRFLRSCLSPES